jgi:hypothetical protein
MSIIQGKRTNERNNGGRKENTEKRNDGKEIGGENTDDFKKITLGSILCS